MKKILIALLIIVLAVTANATVVKRSLSLYDYLSAAAMGDLDTVMLWVHLENDVDAVDKNGNTALILASETNQELILKYLLDHGADINKKNNYGYTALHSAIANEHSSAVRLLLNLNADVNVKNIYNTTPLDLVKAKGAKDVNDYVFVLDSKPKGVFIQGPNSFLYTKKWQQKILSGIDNESVFEEELKKASEDGDVEATYALASYLYQAGNIEDAAKYALKASNKGNVKAKFMVGKYHIGKGNKAEGAKEVCLAADGGSFEAMAYCGSYYYLGNGVEKNFDKAYEYLSESLTKEQPLAVYYLGLMAYNGEGVEKDHVKGLEDIYKAANSGWPEAISKLEEFTTDDLLNYLKQLPNLKRNEVKTYILSQGGILTKSVKECDFYSMDSVYHLKHGVKKIKICYPNLGLPKMTFGLDENLSEADKDFLAAYQKQTSVEYVHILK